MAIERISNKTIPEYIYVAISFLIVTYLLFDMKSGHKEFGNYLHPIFKEDFLTLTLIVIVSHMIGYFGFKLIQKKLESNAT